MPPFFTSFVTPSPTEIIGPDNLYTTEWNAIKTQKAKGVKAIQHYGNVPLTVHRPRDVVLILPQNTQALQRKAESNEELTLWRSKKWFARPCPVVPRHGFVESREITLPTDAIAVLEEARKEDPEAEVLIFEKYTGAFSGVATNSGVTWGRSNDGVTSGGKGQTFLIPTPSTSVKAWQDAWGIEHLMHSQGTAYVELVENQGSSYVVQYRDGPEQPATKDYIPHLLKAEVILKSAEFPDLLAWEKEVKSWRGHDNVVIQLPTSDALSSHYAVHGLALGIPVVTSHYLKHGENLKAVDYVLPELCPHDYQKIAAQIEKWMEVSPNNIPYDHNWEYSSEKSRRALATSIATIHALSAWDNSEHLLTLRAFAFPALLKFIASSALGELRHWGGNGPGRSGSGSGRNRTMKTAINYIEESLYTRDQVYRKAMRFTSVRDIAELMRTANEDFLTKGWEPMVGRNRRGCNCEECVAANKKGKATGYSYGGPNWAAVAKAGEMLARAMETFLVQPTKATWTELVLSANSAVHTVHNGGYALNKWIGEKEMTRIANVPALGFLNDVAANLVLGNLTPASIKDYA